MMKSVVDNGRASTAGRWSLILIGAFALIFSTFRAYSQAVTLDETDTYFWFVAKGFREVWHPFPNNHTLNTLLIWIVTQCFGLHALTLRIPALMGSALYISTCFFLVSRIAAKTALQLPVFVWLIYN